MEKETKRIYEMQYDRDYNDDGSMRPNRYLGTFEVVEQINEDIYSEEFLGKREEDGLFYEVVGREKSGIGGGVKYKITPVDINTTIETLENKLKKLKNLTPKPSY